MKKVRDAVWPTFTRGSKECAAKDLLKKIGCQVSAIIFSVVLITGCAEEKAHYAATNDRIDQSAARTAALQAADDRTAPSVVSRSGYYVNTSPIALSHLPSWMNNRVNLQADRMPMNELVKQLLKSTNINARYDNTVEPARLVTMHYRGTVQGALDTLAAQTRYFYTLDDGSLSWSAFETKTFDVSFMPGSSEYLVGQQSGGNSGGIASTSSSGYGTSGSNTGSQAQNALNDNQFSNLKGELSIWKDMEKGLDALKSPDGKIMVSQSTTTVTVHDHPTNVEAMARYIQSMNIKLSRQVAIKVEVVDVTLDDAFNQGINWDAVFHALNQTFTIGGDLANAANIAQTAAVLSGSPLGIGTFTISSDNASTVIQALSQQGKVSVVTKPQVVTMNNQVATIRITTDVAYVQSSSATAAAGSGSNVVTSSIQPGVVTEGFTMYVLPKIQGKDVFMQISSTITNLLALQTATNAPPGATVTGNSQFVSIQTPVLAQKVFNQRSMVKDGDTLVIAGFKQLSDQVSNSKMFGIGALGGKGAAKTNVETLVLITPVVLKE